MPQVPLWNRRHCDQYEANSRDGVTYAENHFYTAEAFSKDWPRHRSNCAVCSQHILVLVFLIREQYVWFDKLRFDIFKCDMPFSALILYCI